MAQVTLTTRSGLLGLTVAAAVMVSAALAAQEPTFPARATGVSTVALRQLFADYWRWHLANQPEDATRVGVHSFDDRWQDWSKTARVAARERRQEFLRNFQYAGLGNLTNRERMSLALIQQRLAAEASTENLRLLSRLAPGGVHAEVFRVVGLMPTGSVSDYERLLARLRALPAYVEQHIEVWSEQLAGGMTQPASVVDRVVVEIEAQRRITADRSPLLEAFRSFPASVPAAERARLEQAAGTAYAEQFVPAWERLGRFLRDTYRPRVRPNPSVGQRPAGIEQYSALLGYYGAPAEPVDTLHEQAMSEVARLAQAVAGPNQSGGVSAQVAETAVGDDARASVPEFRRHLRLPAFEDGWRVFAGPTTRLAFETAVKAALDSGIHVRGWSRAEALAFATTNLRGEAGDVVDLVASTPARALAVFAGARKFAALQQAARAKLGERFDQRVFDRTVLDGGVLPLDLVEMEIEELLKARPAGTP